MKHPVFVVAALLLWGFPVFSQTFEEIPPGGGGAYQPEPSACLTDEQRTAIAAMLVENEAKLRSQGLIGPDDANSVVAFDWPTKAAPGFTWNNAVILGNYVDQHTATGTLDYNCGARTYDGHKGTDISLWPFPWHLKNNDLIQVVAAAAGVILAKQDGNSDENCTWNNQQWNAVYVRHSDGSVAWYGHLKKNSLTNKAVGASVAKGEYLGIVASSGISTGPHLHFEVYKQQPYQFSNLIDPYSGTCNGLNPGVSWWANQESYRKPTLNAAITHNAPPEHGCPTANEDPYFSDQFAPGGGKVYTAVYFRDQQQGQFTSMLLRQPNGTTWHTWGHTSPDTYSGSWWWWSWNLPVGGPFGTWTFEATFNGQTIVHPFVYGNMVSTDSEDNAFPLALAPNPTGGTFRIWSSEQIELDMHVFDGMGRLCFARKAQTNQDVVLEDMVSGVYVVRVAEGGRVRHFRLVRE